MWGIHSEQKLSEITLFTRYFFKSHKPRHVHPLLSGAQMCFVESAQVMFDVSQHMICCDHVCQVPLFSSGYLWGDNSSWACGCGLMGGLMWWATISFLYRLNIQTQHTTWTPTNPPVWLTIWHMSHMSHILKLQSFEQAWTCTVKYTMYCTVLSFISIVL